MRLFGYVIKKATKALSEVASSRGETRWWRILEKNPGDWQRDVKVDRDSVLAFSADFACRTLIASDIAKLRLKLVANIGDDIWQETTNPAYSPVLRTPNHFQNQIQFFESWALSKLQEGNTYVLKHRDGRNVVKKMYVLDPTLVTPLVSSDGAVFYRLRNDHLSGLPEEMYVPAREIIHDRFNCFFHPLIGIAPLYAGGLAAMQGLAIQEGSTTFFKNGAQVGGILSSSLEMSDKDAAELGKYFNEEFGGKNRGKVAVVGGGLQYHAVSAKAVDSQLLEQLKWTADVVCSVYHVPPYKVGMGPVPANTNVQALNIEYYSSCLQSLIESIERCLDEGLGMDGVTLGTEFDTDALMRMDTLTQYEVAEKAKGIKTLNERRQMLGVGKIAGGNTIHLQQQDHSLAAIEARDRALIEGVNNPPEPPPANDNPPEVQAAYFGAMLRKNLKGDR